MSRKAKAKLQAEDAPNIQYVGRRHKFDKQKLKMTPTAKAVPAFIMDGKEKIKLPDGIENGIFMPPEIVARLFALRPDDFKTPVLKAMTQPAQPAAKPTTKTETEQIAEDNK